MARIEKIISGGQCGADRAGLEAGLLLGIETGGWIIKGFMTVKGPDLLLRDRFHLKEIESTSYPKRSMKNVDDSDGTIVFRSISSAGSDCTIGYCITHKWKSLTANEKSERKTLYKPCLVINLETIKDTEKLSDEIRDFVRCNNIKCLNIAGHREDVFPGYSDSIIKILVKSLSVDL